MADQKISALTELTSLATDDVLPIVDTSTTTTKKVTIDTLTDYAASLSSHENLLDNSGFGVWPNSDTNVGIGPMPYDAGSVAPVVGETLTGGTSGAVGKVISFTLTGGAWGSSSAAGVISLGACSGRFNDNEAVTGSTAAALVVNTPAGARGVDLVAGGEFEAVTDWTAARGTLAVVAGGKVGNCLQITRDSGVSQPAYQQVNTGVGKIYRATGYVKSGTSGDEAYRLAVYENQTFATVGASINGTSSSSWVKFTLDFEATSIGPQISVEKLTATAGTMLFDEISLYEITPGCTAADALAMDGWLKATNTESLYRVHDDGGTLTHDGSFYAVKLIPIGTVGGFTWWAGGAYNKAEFYQKFTGRTVTFGAWIKAFKAGHAKLLINDGSDSYSDAHSGAGGWEWIEVTKTVSATATQFLTSFRSINGANVDGSTVVYVSQPMLVFGSSIGSGNYSPKPSETVFCETAIGFTALDNVVSQSDVADAVLNVEANTAGKVPKGAKALLVSAATNDSGSAGTDCSMSLGMSATNYSLILSPAGLANDAKARQAGLVTCDANGDFHYVIDASGSATFDITKFKIVGVQLR